MMTSFKRFAVFTYGVAAYLLFLGVFLYAIGFVGNFGVPKSIDSQRGTPWANALAIDLGLLAVFALQHSVMARRGFKRMVTRVIPAAAERSTYVLASSAALGLLFWKWEPLGGVVWHVEAPIGRGLLYAGFAFGWLLVLVATFAINHFDLFGLRQVWTHLHRRQETRLQFATPALYRLVRHPLYLGWFFVFWSTPDMTLTHAFFAAATTAYILVAIQFEERDLMREHSEYSVYKNQVPMIIPSVTGARSRRRPIAGEVATARTVSAK